MRQFGHYTRTIVRYAVAGGAVVGSGCIATSGASTGTTRQNPQHESMPFNEAHTSKSTPEKLLENCIQSNTHDLDIQKLARQILWDRRFLNGTDRIFSKHASKLVHRDQEDMQLADRKAVERAFDETCLSVVCPTVSVATGRQVPYQVATLDQLKQWIREIKGTDTFTLTREEFTFIVQSYALSLLVQFQPQSTSWYEELMSIDSPQALVQMGGVALLVLFFCLRSKKILGK